MTALRTLRPATLAALAVMAMLALLPLVSQGYVLSNWRDVMLLALFALSLDLFWGRTGILSFGHATFFGLGAYGMAIATTRFGIDPAWASLAGLGTGIGLAVLVAALVGYFMIYGGVRGAYFTIVTLALTIVANNVAIGWSSVTGGDSGLVGVPPITLFGLSLATPQASFWLAFAVLGLCLAASLRVMNGRIGLILAAIRDSELKAETLGYRTSLILLATFVVSAAMAALAGAIYATGTGFVAPDMIALLLSTEVIIWVAVGGSGSLVGAVVGTVVVWHLQQKVSSISVAAWPIVIGSFFILLVLVFPRGLPDFVLTQARRWQARKGGRG